MLIDWFTVGAQALNFVILVWLMKRFLYKPVLDAIDAREKGIAAELADADAKKAAAQVDRDALQQKSDAFDRQRSALMAEATADANAERVKMIDAAHQAADALSTARHDTMEADATNFNRSLRQRTQVEVFAIARRTLVDLAGASLEASACDLFIVRLRALDDASRDGLATALKSSTDGALVRTAFDLPQAQRTAVQNAIDDTFATSVVLRFETVPSLVGGIELSAHGLKFAWSITDYLASLERGVDELSKSGDPPIASPTKPAATPPQPRPEAVAA